MSAGWSGLKCMTIRSMRSSGEKEIKKWRRAWKIALIEKENPDWRDLHPEITK
jgi:predicted GIY-YIG superfamily endonuclease